MDQVLSLPTLDQLRQHVRAVLCEHDQLDPDAAPLWQSVILRPGRACGLFFEVQGPRRTRSYAVWAGEEGKLLFYDSQGRVFARARLSEAPDPSRLA
jgi:hypothetical protein